MAVPYRRVGDGERQRDETRLQELERLRELIAIRARMQEEPEQEEPQAPADFAAPRLSTPGPRQVKVNLKDIPGKVEKFIHEPAKGVDPESATKTFLNFFENAARTAGQFVEFPVDIVKQVQEAMLAPDAEEKLYKFAVNNLKGIVDFTGQNIVDLVSAVHPLTSPEARKEAQDRIFGTGGLGPIAAISGLKHGITQVPKVATTLKAGVGGLKGAPKAGEAAEVPPTAAAPTPAPAPKVEPRPRAARPEVPEEPKAIDEINAIRHAPDATLRNETLQILGKERQGEIARMSRSNLEYYVSAGRTGVPYEPKAAAPPAEIDLKPREIEIVRDVAKDLGDVTEAAQERVLEEAVAAEAPKKIEAVAEAQTRKVRRRTVKDENREWVELFDLVQKRKATDAEVERFMELSKTRGAAAAKPEDANAGAVQKEEAPPPVAEEAPRVSKTDFDELVERADETERSEPTEVDLYWNENKGRYEEVLNEIDDLADAMGDRHADPGTLERGKRLADELAQIEEQATAVRTGERTAVLEKPKVEESLRKEQFSDVVEIPISEIKTDVARFQERVEPFSEETARDVHENFDPNKWKPVDVFKDPETGETFMLSGHSRLEGLKRRGAQTVQSVYFKGTEEQARNFARIEANRLQNAPTFAEGLGSFKLAKESGYTKAQLKTRFKSESEFFEAAQNLNPGGKFVEILNQPAQSEFPYIKRTARWVGELRRDIPQLTDAHEHQLFDWLYQTTGKKGYENWRTPKDEFVSMVSRMTGDAFFDPRKPLIFKFDRLREAGMRGRSDAAKTVAKIDKIKSQIKANIDLAKSGEPLKRVLEINKDLEAELSRLETDLQTLEKAQPDIFGPNVQGFVDGMANEISYFHSGFDMFDPFLSLQESGVRNWDKFKKFAAVKLGMRYKESGERKVPVLSRYLGTQSNVFESIPPDRPNPSKALGGDVRSLVPDKPRYGRLAAKTQEAFDREGIDFLTDLARRDAELAKIVANIDDKDYGKMGEAFFDLFESNSIDKLLADETVSERTRGAAYLLKEWFDDKKRIRLDFMRDQARGLVTRQTKREYRKNRGMASNQRLTVREAQAVRLIVDSRLRTMIPDDWGPAQYLPNNFPGQYRIMIKGKFYNSAYTRFDAKLKMLQAIEDHPELKPADLTYEMRQRYDPDIVRIGNNKRHAIISDIARDMHIPRDEIEGYFRGKIGAKEFRAKWNGNFQKRVGYEGYVKNLPFVLNSYNWAFTRWEHLTSLNRRVQPAIDKLRKNGREVEAEVFEKTLEHVWGKRHASSKLVDDAIQNYWFFRPIRDHVSPMLLDRWGATVRTLSAIGYIKGKLQWHIMNNLQFIDHTLPILGENGLRYFAEGLRAKGGKFTLTPEQRELLEWSGVKYLTSGKMLEARGMRGFGFRMRPGGKKPSDYLLKLREAQSKAGIFASETTNQEAAFLAMFKKGIDQGLSKKEARYYAITRGNVFTQYLPYDADTPRAFRGPVGATIGLFRRFPIKDIELGARLIRDKNYPAAGKFIGARLLLGGLRAPFKVAGWLGAGYLAADAYRHMKESLGEDAANIAMFGLPSIVGTDWSASYNLLDLPYGNTPQETLGKLLVGIPGDVIVSTAIAGAYQKGPYPYPTYEKTLKSVSEKVPALRWIQLLYNMNYKLADGQYDFRDPVGRTRYRTDMKNMLYWATGNKPLDWGIDALYLDWLTSVGSMYDRSLDKQVQEVMRANQEGRPINLKEMNDWAALWPEFTYGTSEILTRYKARIGMRGETQFERAAEAFPKKFQYDERVRERAIGR